MPRISTRLPVWTIFFDVFKPALLFVGMASIGLLSLKGLDGGLSMFSIAFAAFPIVWSIVAVTSTVASGTVLYLAPDRNTVLLGSEISIAAEGSVPIGEVVAIDIHEVSGRTQFATFRYCRVFLVHKSCRHRISGWVLPSDMRRMAHQLQRMFPGISVNRLRDSDSSKR